MRVLFVNNYPGPSIGGGEVQLSALIDGLLAAGVEVAAVCETGSATAEMLRAKGIEVSEVGFGVRSTAAAVRAVRRAAGAHGADIVQGTGYFTNLITRMAARGASWRLVNMVHVEPSSSVADGGSSAGLVLRDIAERATVGRADAIVAVSDAVARSVEARYSLAPGRVRVIYNGVDAAALRAEAAAALPRSSAGPVVGALARLERVKGIEHLIRALPRLSEHHPAVRLVIGGSGSLESDLRTVAVATGCGDRIEFRGRVASAGAFLATLDVVAVPSLAEGLGLTALEGMALGKPVVASAVGGLCDVVVDGVTGVLVPPASPEALAAAIGEILGDPQRAREMGEAGRRRVDERFTVERMVGEYTRLYSELASTAGGAIR